MHVLLFLLFFQIIQLVSTWVKILGIIWWVLEWKGGSLYWNRLSNVSGGVIIDVWWIAAPSCFYINKKKNTPGQHSAMQDLSEMQKFKLLHGGKWLQTRMSHLIELESQSVQCNSMHNNSMHYILIQCIALHYIALHWITECTMQ